MRLALVTPTIPRSEAVPVANLLGALDIVRNVAVPQVWNMNSVHWANMRHLSSTPIKITYRSVTIMRVHLSPENFELTTVFMTAEGK